MHEWETAPRSKPIPLGRPFPNLSLPGAPLRPVLLRFHRSLLAPPLLLPRPLGREGVGPRLGLARRQVEGPLELLELPQEPAALLGRQVLGPLRDEHLDVEGRAVDLPGARRQGGLELLEGKSEKRVRWVIPPWLQCCVHTKRCTFYTRVDPISKVSVVEIDENFCLMRIVRREKFPSS